MINKNNDKLYYEILNILTAINQSMTYQNIMIIKKNSRKLIRL